MAAASFASIMRDHVALSVTCLDRLYLNGYVPTLQSSGIPFEALDNGFRWSANPARLQAVCDALGPSDVQAFFDRWVDRLPWPLTSVDRAAGYRHRLSLWQVEVSLTPDLPGARLRPPLVRSHPAREPGSGSSVGGMSA